MNEGDRLGGSKMKRLIVVALACVALVACGKSLSGTYVAKQGSGLGAGLVMEKMNFIDGSNVELTMMAQTVRAPYKIDGESLLITVQGQTQVFKIDKDGCLDGGDVFGKLCKA
jgi:hypothetical protein